MNFLAARKLKGDRILEGVLFFADFWCWSAIYQLYAKINRENIVKFEKKYLNGTNVQANGEPSI